MGRVWAAEDRALRREVALKEVRPGVKDPAAAAARLRREAWITARLDHPGVIAVHDIGEDARGEPFYTMRLVRGRSLAAALQACPDLDARLGLLRALLAATEAVAAAHAVGLVHRDLKPDNILIGGLGETQVVDWGLAAPAGPLAARWAAEGLPPAGTGVVGTPGWMAPEQARGEPAGPASDVWALGAILHALLAGGPPAEAPPPPDAPPELVAVAARAMDPDPARRYPDAAALAEDLDRHFRGLRVRAHAYTSAELLQRFLVAWRVPIRVGLIGLIAVIGALLLGLRAAQAERPARSRPRRRRGGPWPGPRPPPGACCRSGPWRPPSPTPAPARRPWPRRRCPTGKIPTRGACSRPSRGPGARPRSTSGRPPSAPRAA
jgi:serine/threonine protein kinase